MEITPVFVEKPWGGNYISDCYQIQPKHLIGEAFLISTLESQENTKGGTPLSYFTGKLPYLIKLIDANDHLSVQVHPNDEVALELEGSSGKTECWLVLDAKEGSGIYYGLRDSVSKESFFESISRNEDVSRFLNFIPVQKFDFISVPAGTIHAIGAGVRIMEFQQTSGITYRIWDWNRQGRELHLEKSIIASNQEQPAPVVENYNKFPEGCFFHHPDFILTKLSSSTIVCSSQKTSVKFSVDLETFEIGMIE